MTRQELDTITFEAAIARLCIEGAPIVSKKAIERYAQEQITYGNYRLGVKLMRNIISDNAEWYDYSGGWLISLSDKTELESYCNG